MKILHIISSLEIGGAQRLLSDLLPLMAKGNNVTLLINQDVDNDFARSVKLSGVKIVEANCGLHSPKNILQISKLAKDFDIVHVHLFPNFYWAAFASMLTSMHLVYTEHSTSNRRRGKWYFRVVEKFIYSRYDKIISISQQTQESLTKWLNSDDSRFVVINNGVNLQSFQNMKVEKMYPHTLIMVSRFADSKDQKTVIRAMKLLPNDVHVVFVGDGDTLSDCKALAIKEKVAERTHFVGRQSDVASWIAKADIGVQSSNWEGFGLTAVEIMAAGMPIVASDVNGLKQVVEGAGELFPVGDDSKLASIVRLLISDKGYYTRVSERCRDRAAKYDIRVMAEKYEDVYNQLIKC